MDPNGKVILVTGASSGIGLALARTLAREGARTIFAARSFDTLEAEVARATAAGGTALAVRLDVTDDASVAAAIAQVLARFGRIDALINNAGNGGRLGWWASAQADHTRAMFDVHVLGTERMIRGVLPAMAHQGGGTILNFASTVAWVPMPGAAAYSAAKAAVVALSQTLRTELAGQGIDVRLFAPPHTRTDAGLDWPLDLPKIFEPDWVAREVVKALRGTRAQTVAGGNQMLLWLQRLSPPLAARIMNGLGAKAVARVMAQLPR